MNFLNTLMLAPVLVWIGFTILLITVVLWIKHSKMITRKKALFLLISFIFFVYNLFWIEFTTYGIRYFEPLTLLSTFPAFIVTWHIYFLCKNKIYLEIMTLAIFVFISGWCFGKNILDILWLGTDAFF